PLFLSQHRRGLQLEPKLASRSPEGRPGAWTCRSYSEADRGSDCLAARRSRRAIIPSAVLLRICMDTPNAKRRRSAAKLHCPASHYRSAYQPSADSARGDRLHPAARSEEAFARCSYLAARRGRHDRRNVLRLELWTTRRRTRWK